MTPKHLKILVQLAEIDGSLGGEEVALIHRIATSYDLSKEDIRYAFHGEPQLVNLDGLSDDEKYDLLYHLVQLMKIDGKLHKDEVSYVAKISSHLGYEESVLLELMIKVKNGAHLLTDKESLKSAIQKHLKH